MTGQLAKRAKIVRGEWKGDLKVDIFSGLEGRTVCTGNIPWGLLAAIFILLVPWLFYFLIFVPSI